MMGAIKLTSFLFQVHILRVQRELEIHRNIYAECFKKLQKRGSSYHLMRNTSSPCLSVEPMMHSGSG